MEPWMFGAIVGGGTALVLLVVMSIGGDSRNSVVLTVPGDVVGTIRGWATHHGYVEKPSDGQMLKFQKGKGFLTAPTVMEVRPVQGGTQVDIYSVLTGIRKRKIALSSGNFVGKLPRKKALDEFNQLLGSLGYPPIQ